MAIDDQSSKALILLILALARIKRKRVVLSPIVASAVTIYAFRFTAAQVVLLGRSPQLDRAECYTMIRARRRNIQPP